MSDDVFPNRDLRIDSPAEFTQVLRELKRCVSAGVLFQLAIVSDGFSSGDVASLPEQPPWPDFVEARFQADDGRQFKLSVDIYHGRGGTWEQL